MRPPSRPPMSVSAAEAVPSADAVSAAEAVPSADADAVRRGRAAGDAVSAIDTHIVTLTPRGDIWGTRPLLTPAE